MARYLIMAPIVLLLWLTSVNADIYLDDSYPFARGPLNISNMLFRPNRTSGGLSSMYTRVAYPDEELDQSFGILYFISGYDGIFPSEVYSDILAAIATHGYVVIGTWPVGGEEGPDFSEAAHFENYYWMKENLNDYIPARADFDYVAFGCHSAGCGTTYTMASMDNSIALASLMWEPVSPQVRAGVNFTLPAYILGAALADGICSWAGVDYDTFYNFWTCPKLKVVVNDVGHCDLLNQLAWEACKTLDICPVGNATILEPYRNYIQGASNAFMRTYLQGDKSALKWVRDTTEAPAPITFRDYAEELQCVPEPH